MRFGKVINGVPCIKEEGMWKPLIEALTDRFSDVVLGQPRTTDANEFGHFSLTDWSFADKARDAV